MLPNKVPGPCSECSAHVPANAGTLAESGPRFVTVCAKPECRQRAHGLAPVVTARVLRADGTIPLPENDPDAKMLRAIAEWDQSAGAWRVVRGWGDRLLVFDVLTQLDIELDSNIEEHTWPELIAPASFGAHVRSAASDGGRVYQTHGAAWLASHPRALLADEMGLGKSRQALMALPERLGLLVVCPAVVKAVWVHEIKKWRPDRFDEVTVCEGWGSFTWPKHARHAVIINYEIIPPQRSEFVSDSTKRPGAITVVQTIELERAAKDAWKDGAMGGDCEGGPYHTKRLGAGQSDHEWWTKSDELLAKAWSKLHRLRDQSCGTKIFEPLESLRDIRRGVSTISKSRAGPCAVVFDECHKIKSNKALMTRRCRVIARSAEIVWGSTGTPIENRPEDLWGVLTSLGAKPPQWSKGKFAYDRFMESFGGVRGAHGGYAFDTDDDGAIKVRPGTSETLRRTMLRRTKPRHGQPRRRSDVESAELPPITFSELPVPLTPDLLDVVVQLEACGPRALEILESGEIPNIQEYSRTRKLLAAARIPAMLQWIEMCEDAGIAPLILSAHRAPIDRLLRRKGWLGISGATARGADEKSVEAFQAGEGKGFAGTFPSMGFGITLTRASHVLVVSQELSPAKNEQGYSRVWRIGQEHPVHVTVMYSDHPLEERVMQMLWQKSKLSERTLGDG